MPIEKTCKHCGRTIVQQADGTWVDPNATGDDSVWRETCDCHDTFVADHEPVEISLVAPRNDRLRERVVRALANVDGTFSRGDVAEAVVAALTDPPGPSYIVEQHRAFGAPTVRFGPFATLYEAIAWCQERGFGSIIEVHSPTVDTAAGAEVWR